MKLVVNTNRIIAALIKDSTSRKIIFSINAELMTIDLSERELAKYKKEILEKAGISEEIFENILNKLKEKLIIIDDSLILTKMDKAKEIMDKIDPNDSQFIAAALATNSDIWSDDNHFQKQEKVKIWKTEELLKFI